ncbi:MAG: FG-GAP-like repeat-containing protein [Gemmatimonadota bacterium]|nr:FG-GAP-like repeat-containing protein [Gemmatimonadota bacterium]
MRRAPRGLAAVRRTATTGALVALGAVVGSCGGDADPRAAGTVRMAERLAAAADSVHPLEDEQLNLARWRHFMEMGQAPDPAAEVLRQGMIAQEMLFAGYAAPALDQLLLLRQLLVEADREPVPGFLATLEELVGVALLRRAGEAACPALRPLPAPDSAGPEPRFPCWPTVPPRSPSAPPDSALEIYEDAMDWQRARLAEDPADLRARWMLNLAAIGAGTWPDGLEVGLRLSRSELGGEGELPRFPEVAADVGLDAVSVSGGGIVDDFDGDGLLDVMASSRGLDDPLRYFRNDGTGHFEERTLAAGLEGLVGGLNLVHADYDNDGDPDVLVLRGGWLVNGFPNSLLRNDGGRFVDVTEEAGLLSSHPTQTAAWADYDGDGWLDLFIGNESRDGRAHVSELYRSNGDGTFTETAAAVGLGVAAFVKGVDWGDVDDDGRPDLYISIFQAPNRLYRNAGPDGAGGWRFEDITERAGVSEPGASFPTWFWDFDNDGREDLFVSGYSAQTADIVREALGEPHDAELPRLYRNAGDGTFVDVTAERGLDRILYAMGSNYGDLDNDGWLDLYLGTGDPDLRQLMPNRMFRNAAGRFEEVSGAGGFGHLDKGHGVSFADIDNDGDQDVHIVLGGANEGDLSPNALFENPGSSHRWVVLHLEGERANRSGLGARLRIEVGGPDGPRTIHRTAGTGGSFGANPLRQEIGLGRADRIELLEIRWPGSGTVDRLTGLEPGRAYRIREGSGVAEAIQRPSLRLGG